MAFRHIGDILAQVIPKSLSEACFLVGVEPKQVPFDGKFHTVRLINDADDINNGLIKIQPDGLYGLVRNIKTGKTQIFYVREISNFNASKPTPPNKKKRIRKDSVGSIYLKAIKHRLAQEVRL